MDTGIENDTARDDRVRNTRCVIHSTVVMASLTVWLFDAYGLALSIFH